ncbi:hypothetical protein BJ508DRAFT_379502 [Ascobolus immersus RN42]|uniref:Uncharacterized protein n=1 Tax=Ascobolus immersus RN42 TaxID=1160509 RepID=A0A3N4I3A0_ASCIM|nr:hypothetical protein BJ508DRAFT_379502 [Ascobolus immersus RN42]
MALNTDPRRDNLRRNSYRAFSPAISDGSGLDSNFPHDPTSYFPPRQLYNNITTSHFTQSETAYNSPQNLPEDRSVLNMDVTTERKQADASETTLGGKKYHSIDGSTLDRNMWKWSTADKIQPAMAALCFVLGLGAAIGHHVYNTVLDEQDVGDGQMWSKWIGNGLAYFAKTMFVATVGVAWRQQIWNVVRKRFISIEGVDTLFNLLGQPVGFFKMEVWKNGLFAVLVAIFAWLIPLAAILAPTTLSIVDGKSIESDKCFVPSLNIFSRDGPEIMPQLFKDGTVANVDGSLKALSMKTAYGQQIVDYPSPCGVNCTYNIDFVGPTYKCEEKPVTAQVIADERWNLWGGFMDGRAYHTKWYRSSLLSTRNEDFMKACMGDSTCLSSNQGNFWLQSGNGVFKIAHRYLASELRNATLEKRLSPSGNITTGFENFQNFTFQCTQYMADYRVNVTFVNDKPFQKYTLRYRDPVNWWNATEAPNFNTAYGLHYVLQALYSGFVGETDSSGATTVMFDNSSLTGTGLFESDGYSFATPRLNLREKFEELHQNLTLSLLSTPDLRPYMKTAVDCQRFNTRNIYKYEPAVLLASYGAAILVSLISLILGGLALVQNGIPSDTGFSRIMLATRNPTLDKLAYGQGLGEPSEGIMSTRVKFGVIGEGVGFGVEGEVRRLKKPGKAYE